jgi:hypothetical protein
LGKKKVKYLEEPIRITPESKEEKELRLKRERDKFLNFLKNKIKDYKTN